LAPVTSLVSVHRLRSRAGLGVVLGLHVSAACCAGTLKPGLGLDRLK